MPIYRLASGSSSKMLITRCLDGVTGRFARAVEARGSVAAGRGGRLMIYRVLGDLELRDRAGAPVTLPSGRAAAVLAALLIMPNRKLSHAELLTAAWGTAEVRVAQLHKRISTLRRLLAEAGLPDAIKTYDRFGYALEVGEDDLDMLVFQRLVRQADADKAAGRVAEETAHIRAALDLWRGPEPLANVTGHALMGDVDHLKRRRRRVAARLFAIENTRGRPETILDELQQFAAEDPADTSICRLLMTALYLSGQSAEAIRAYDRYVDAIESGNGGRPDPALRDLCYAMSNHQDDVVAKAAGVAAGAGAAPVPRQLPAAPADFVGRGDLLADLARLLREPAAPVLVVSGAGGIGKTALALRAAHDRTGDYPDGQLWAELRGTTSRPADPAEVLAQFLRALGAHAVPEAREERAKLFRSLLAERRVLVVLDDAATAGQIRDLIPGGSGSIVLVTARRRLPGIREGVHHVARLAPFDPRTAMAFFRSVVASGDVDLSGEDQAVAEVVRLCDGLPLALRIAASLRVEEFYRPTADLLRRLAEQGPTAFEYGDESLARTLGAGLAPLDDDARRLFVGLGLLTVPTFGEWTAAALLGRPGPAAAALAQLAAVSMIDPVWSGTRFRLHDLTREYARGLAELTPERSAAPIRVGRALLTLTRRAHAALYGGDFDVVHSDLADVPVPPSALAEASGAPRDWFECERLNIRAVVEQAAALGQAAVCWDLAVSAHEFFTLGEYFDDWRTTHRTALAASRAAGDRRGEGIVLVSLGQPALVASGSPGVSGVPELETAIRLLSEAGERHGRAIALRTLGNALRRRGELDRPLALFTSAVEYYEQSGDVVGSMQTLRFIGQTHLDRGDHDRALEMFRRSEHIARGLGRPRLVAQTRYWAGRALLARRDLAGAGAAFRDVLGEFPPGSGVGHGYALHGLGELAAVTGEPDVARRHLTQAQALARDGADVLLEGRVGLSLAALEAAQGHPAAQIIALMRAAARFQACGATHLEIEAHAALAEAHARVGDPDGADAARQRVAELSPPDARRPGR
jgi:DNA-binding SARP family transcriptional activator